MKVKFVPVNCAWLQQSEDFVDQKTALFFIHLDLVTNGLKYGWLFVWWEAQLSSRTEVHMWVEYNIQVGDVTESEF